ncbi:hypothetical protein ACLB2K_067243 [Fragaria x ananassa]
MGLAAIFFEIEQTESFASVLMVVLDLDETLVCAYKTSSVPAIVRTQATDAGMKWLKIECKRVETLIPSHSESRVRKTEEESDAAPVAVQARLRHRQAVAGRLATTVQLVYLSSTSS